MVWNSRKPGKSQPPYRVNEVLDSPVRLVPRRWFAARSFDPGIPWLLLAAARLRII